jgi:hypothetical protein
MFREADIKQINDRGSALEVVNAQIENFKKGFPFLKLESAATPADGIMILGQKEISKLVQDYDKKSSRMQIVKFVPASGAASRMFKLLFSFLEVCHDLEMIKGELGKSDDLQSIKVFFDRIGDFAFYDDLDATLQNENKSIAGCLSSGDYASLLRALLESQGLDYGNSPKGLLKFHKYEYEVRTPVMEHLAEGALYAQSKNKTVNIHFTVSPEHREKFQDHIREVASDFEKYFGVKYNISFSEQKAYTDTIAVDLGNEPFRNQDNSLLFRPAGHGALIANLNDIDADIIFIKNIDNVVPDKLKRDTIKYKKALAGTLLEFQEAIFDYLHLLDGKPNMAQIDEMMDFVSDELRIDNIPGLKTGQEKVAFLKEKLNRPIRVCGMVKNEGEPGGGPFYTLNNDNTISLQIVESSQIDFNIDQQRSIALGATHFNPVDLVCAVKNYKGAKFDLTKYVDPKTGFISQKSKDGKELKAQELPGLWNGAMSDWNTIFVEVPISTFNPVKTVNDLLRPQHQ